jgi:hypothetical protein
MKLNRLLSIRWVLPTLAIFVAVYLLLLYPWMMRWGATDAELGMPLPGDEIVPVVGAQSTRAVTIHAPAAQVWKWVVQLGQERAGFYSNDWLENLTLADIHNADELRPEWQKHQDGDHVLGAGGIVYGRASAWRVQAYKEGKSLYLWANVVVIPVDAQTSRLLTRTRVPPAPFLAQLMSQLSYDWMHFVMERGMLLGIKARAEGTLTSNQLLRSISGLGWIAATIALIAFFLTRRRGRWWGLLPWAYALAILIFTFDPWAAMAGFLWWGIVIAGFVAFGRAWWKGLSIAIVAVVLTFVLAPQPQLAFGIIFLIALLVIVAIRILRIQNAGQSTWLAPKTTGLTSRH